MSGQLGINSIYLGTEGEGIHIGIPQIFVRLQGCNIRCHNCDSKDTWDFDCGTKLSIMEIVEKVRTISSENNGIKRISITGGDILDDNHKSLFHLITALKSDRNYINIEISGLKINHKILDSVDYISSDYKTPSTGIKPNIETIKTLVKQYPGKFQVKSVVQNLNDFNHILKIKDENNLDSFPWVITPCFESNEETPFTRFQEIIEENHKNGAPFRVIIQQHKVIYGPNLKQV